MRFSRELAAGLLAAALSIILLSGSIVLSLVEDRSTAAMIPPETMDLSPTVPTLTATTKPEEPTQTATPTLTPTTTQTEVSTMSVCQPPDGWVAISVGTEETLETLADLYDTTTQALVIGNCLVIDLVRPGTILYVPQVTQASPTNTQTASLTPTEEASQCKPPGSWVIYIVQSGDTLFSISKAFQTTVQELMDANCLSSTNIVTSDRLYVPNVPTTTPNITSTNTPRPTRAPSSTTAPTATTAASTATQTSVPTDTPMPPSNTALPTEVSSPTPIPLTPTDTPTSP